MRSRLFGDMATLVPPVDMMFEGPRSLQVFKENGEEFLRIYRERCGLQPHERVLDVGFGIGRKTIPLLHYLQPPGSYDGLDITKTGVDWCSSRITPRWPNFRFQQIDVYNEHYNPIGRHSAAEYRFPFSDNSFDFVTLGSVFTHMLPGEVENYLSEIVRVMAPGARCLISYFLINDETRRLEAEGVKGYSDEANDIQLLKFRFAGDGFFMVDPKDPLYAVGFEEAWVLEIHRTLGLNIRRIEHGSWSGRTGTLSFQDLILAEKIGASRQNPRHPRSS